MFQLFSSSHGKDLLFKDSALRLVRVPHLMDFKLYLGLEYYTSIQSLKEGKQGTGSMASDHKSPGWERTHSPLAMFNKIYGNFIAFCHLMWMAMQRFMLVYLRAGLSHLDLRSVVGLQHTVVSGTAFPGVEFKWCGLRYWALVHLLSSCTPRTSSRTAHSFPQTMIQILSTLSALCELHCLRNFPRKESCHRKPRCLLCSLLLCFSL